MRPKKQTKRLKKKENQDNKVINCRLMQISLILDDVIYRNKAMPLESFEKYKEEILKYKPMFQNDLRLKLVIDSLLRTMKGIVAETTAATAKCIEKQNPQKTQAYLSGTLSNLEQHTDPSFQLGSETTATKERVENTKFVRMNTAITPVETNFMSGYDEIIKQNGDRHDYVDELKITKAISSLSIANVKDANTTKQVENDIDCSQSLISNFEDDLLKDRLKPSVRENNALAVKKHIINNLNKFGNIDENTSKQNENRLTGVKKQDPPIPTVNNTTHQNIIKNTRTGVKEPKIYIKKPIRKRSEKSTSKDKLTKKQSPKKRRNKNNKCIKKKPKSNDSIVANALPNAFPPENKIHSHFNSLDTASRIINNSRDINNHTGSSCTNNSNQKDLTILCQKHSEHDLSWVENIKYVRVIDKTEYSPANIAESFWSNLEFPQFMGDTDFISI